MNRRIFLRGAAATLWLPFLESAPRAAPADSVRRALWLFVPNGFLAEALTPGTVGAGYTMPTPLEPLEALRARATIVTNLQNRAEIAYGGFGSHESCTASLLTDCTLPENYYSGVPRLGISVDQYAVEQLKPPTPFPSMQLGTGESYIPGGANLDVYYNALSWANAGTPMSALVDPASVFSRMFGGSDPAATAEEVARRTTLRRSVLDAVLERSKRLGGTLNPADRAKLDQYQTSVRELELRIEGLSTLTCPTPDAPADGLGFPQRYLAMMDLLVVAFQCDYTRVATLMAGTTTSLTNFPFLDVSADHHSLSHDWSYDENRRRDFLKVQTWYVQMYVDFCNRLAAIPDPEGDMLSTTLVTLVSEFGESNLHTSNPNVLFAAGGEAGGLVHGRHRDARRAPHSNYLRSSLTFLGADSSGFGPNATEDLDLTFRSR